MMPKTRDGIYSTMYQQQARIAEAKLRAAEKRIEELEAALRKSLAVHHTSASYYGACLACCRAVTLLDTEAKP